MEALKAIVGSPHVSTAFAVREHHGHDESMHRYQKLLLPLRVLGCPHSLPTTLAILPKEGGVLCPALLRPWPQVRKQLQVSGKERARGRHTFSNL